MLRRLNILLDSIKFAHSIFALPFALIAMIVAANGWPSARVSILIFVCMVSGRSAAMAFNRLADRKLDASNPRTKMRPTVTGEISPAFLGAFTVLCCAIFCAATWFLNPVCFYCAPGVLIILLGYSVSKRFTSLCHFWLGLALGLAPVGAHLAVRGNLAPVEALGMNAGISFEAFPILLGLMVLFWVSGFDLIYACQDFENDRNDSRVQSMPKSIGIRGALWMSGVLHALAAALLVAIGFYAGLHIWYFAAVAAVVALLIYEHWIVSPTDLSRVNVAFFTINGVVSLLLFAAVFVERVLYK